MRERDGADKGRGTQRAGPPGASRRGKWDLSKGGKLWYNTARQSPGRAGQAEEGFLL